MLRQLAIRDIVLIEALDLEFGPGLGVLTGETGAGKSILLDALGLALGARADSGLIRSGQPQASVSAELELAPGHPALALLDGAGVTVEDGEPLLLRRTLRADGASRAFVGGVAVAAATLRELGALLVEVHGQHDDRGLLNARGHRRLLDAFGRIDTAEIEQAWQRLGEAREHLAEARGAAEAAARDRDWLDHSASEIAALGPEPGEESSLAERRSALQAAAKAGEALGGIEQLLGGADGALAQLRQAARRIERGAADHALLAEALAALDRAVIDASEGEQLIERAAADMVFNPAELDRIEQRLFDIRALARKHRCDADGLAALAEELSARLEAIDAGDAAVAALSAEVEQARSDFEALAEAISAKRRLAAERLDAAVAGELAPLRLDAARLRTVVAPAEPGPTGADRVEFEVSTNRGAPFGPLARIASGGELARFILALKVALAEAGGASTMIFDEVDRGVGGAVASAIGERLARLAASAQLLVVTHSPQVAARAAIHYRIAKSDDGLVTRTSVERLGPAERREEIARMLSGAVITDEARAQASKLMEAA